MATTSIPGERRSRGRPCKEATDDPGTERRKQIREAQRAYRSRQQDLISSLKERNAVLEDALGKINNIVDSLGLIATADVSLPRSRLIEAVQLVENEVRHRTKCALDASSSQDRPGRLFDFQEQIQSLLASRPSEKHSVSCRTPSQTPTPSLSTLQQKSNFWSSFNQTSHLLIPNPTPLPTPTSDQITLGLSADLSVAPPPSIPIAYATTPFTQRLYRACAESGFRYLTNETVSDEEMWPQFGLMLQRMPRAEIIAYFRRVVATVPCNPLQDPRFPFLSLGGAGGHFNARHAQNTRPGLQYLWPLQAANGVLELPSDEEWFDVHDIEGFLVNQGLELTGGRNVPLSNALALFTPGIYSADFLGSTSLGSIPQTGQTGTASGRWIKTINEDALVEALSGCCVCIGCAAGFLRRDVESFILQNTQWVPPTDAFVGATLQS